MQAAVIDVGSNTIRMVIGEYRDGTLLPQRYEREIVRLAGRFEPGTGLADDSMARALATLKTFRRILSRENISTVRVIGTAALRRAANRQLFIDRVLHETGLQLEVISGDEEAQLTAQGVLAVIEPAVEHALIVDIGGGSTEFICIVDAEISFQKSYPLGVVRLCEEFSSPQAKTAEISRVIGDLQGHLKRVVQDLSKLSLIGTAGTVTTLAAIDLGLTEYIANKINNHVLSKSCLVSLYQKLERLSASEREQLAGMEQGRGDLILPGLEILLSLLDKQKSSSLVVADAGLLEGTFLALCAANSD